MTVVDNNGGIRFFSIEEMSAMSVEELFQIRKGYQDVANQHEDDGNTHSFTTMDMCLDTVGDIDRLLKTMGVSDPERDPRNPDVVCAYCADTGQVDTPSGETVSCPQGC